MERTEPAPPRWGLLEAFAGLVAGLAGMVLSANLWVAVQGSARESLGLTVAILIGLWTGYIGVMVLVSRFKGTGRLAADLRLRLHGAGDVAVGVALGLGTSIVLIPALYRLLMIAGLIDDGDMKRLSDPAERLTEISRGPTFLLLAVLVGLGAPVVEEAFFRGFMQPAAVRRLGAVGGVVVSSVVFAAVHFQALQFPALALFGLVLGVLAHRTGRTGPSVVAHMTFNALTLVGLAVGRG